MLVEGKVVAAEAKRLQRKAKPATGKTATEAEKQREKDGQTAEATTAEAERPHAKAELAEDEVVAEAKRLYDKVKHLGWSMEDCFVYAPLTLEINKLKKEKDAIILAHSYQTPDIIYGIADFVGDSYGLSKQACSAKQKTIVFCGVRFMAETAKILNPEKTVLLPSTEAGCSLSESITAEDVREMREKHPHAGIVTYVNTNADVKAESDACCTSTNAMKVVEGMPQKEIIFLPDELMAKNVAKLTRKKIIGWRGRCIVHEDFDAEKIKAIRSMHPGVKILVHTECTPEVVDASDLAGGTENMISYIKSSDAKQFMLVTECGLGDRMRVEFPEKEIVGTCNLCPYMKKNNLKNILSVLKEPRKEQIVELPEEIIEKAQKALNKMFELTQK
ncbi:quinolinate synthase NadA [Candidatus Micrarchaeota archaeon]|nr:quinolinate synthase NadA [Candidatus Micrarchaeota archaeon]